MSEQFTVPLSSPAIEYSDRQRLELLLEQLPDSAGARYVVCHPDMLSPGIWSIYDRHERTTLAASHVSATDAIDRALEGLDRVPEVKQ